jgi:hypothetical protein
MAGVQVHHLDKELAQLFIALFEKLFKRRWFF